MGMKIVKAIEETELGGGVSRIRIDLDNGVTVLVMNGNESVYVFSTAEFDLMDSGNGEAAELDFCEIKRA